MAATPAQSAAIGRAAKPTQRAVLRAALDVFTHAKKPAYVEHLPFVWHEDPKATRWHPKEPSPIIALIQQRRRE